jgi:hypothetical protein
MHSILALLNISRRFPAWLFPVTTPSASEMYLLSCFWHLTSHLQLFVETESCSVYSPMWFFSIMFVRLTLRITYITIFTVISYSIMYVCFNLAVYSVVEYKVLPIINNVSVNTHVSWLACGTRVHGNLRQVELKLPS